MFGPIPSLPRGSSALDHAVGLVRDQHTGGAILLRDVSVFTGVQHCLLVQRYARETEYQNQLQVLATKKGCGFRIVDGADGIVANFWIAGHEGQMGRWSFEPSWSNVIHEVIAPDGKRFLIERQPSVLCVVESEQPSALSYVAEEWTDPWEVPVLVIVGAKPWVHPVRTVKAAAHANIAKDALGRYFVTFSKLPGIPVLAGHKVVRILVNPELFPWLA